MSKSNAFETALLNLIFKAQTITGIARDDAAPVSLHFSLHTADPGEAGDQTTSETSYGNYARQALARGANFTVTGNSVSPASAINFPQSSNGPVTITHFGVGTLLTGAGLLLYSGTVTPNITVNNGVTPQLTAASTITED